MKIWIVSFTHAGAALAKQCKAVLDRMGHSCRAFAQPRHASEQGLEPMLDNLSEWTQRAFTGDAVVFIGAAGIAVRAIAPYIIDKQTDPCVLSIDEKGRFAVCLLSGHLGGGNALTKALACQIGAEPVISTATDLNGKFAVDVWAKQNHSFLSDMGLAKQVSSALLDNRPVGFYSNFEWTGPFPDGFVPFTAQKIQDLGVCVSLDEKKKPFPQTLNVVPQIVTLGIGCRKGVSDTALEEAVLDVLDSHAISIKAVKQVASIDLKAQEPAILRFCEKYSLPFKTYTAEVLRSLQGNFTASAFVSEVTGVDNICERAAMMGNDQFLIQKERRVAVTVAAAMEYWRLQFENTDGWNQL